MTKIISYIHHAIFFYSVPPFEYIIYLFMTYTITMVTTILPNLGFLLLLILLCSFEIK